MADEGGALREIAVRFTAEVEGEEQLKHVGESADEATEHVKEAGEHAEKAEGLFRTLGEAVEGVAAVFGASELLRGIGETSESLERLAHLSEQTGISTERLEFFGFVVGQVGGDVGDFEGQISNLQRSLAKGEAAFSPAGVALQKLGINTKGANGEARDMNEVLPEIFANFGKLKNPAEEAAVAQRLFGKSGLALLPVLREGAKGFEEYQAQFEAAGGATPQEAIERAQEYERSLKRMSATFEDLKTHLVAGVLPALTDFVETITKGVGSLSKFLKGTTTANHAVFGLAAALAGPLLKALRPFLLPGLKFLGIYAAVDDVLGFLEGKQSVLGDLLNGIFGSGTADQVREFFGVVKAEFGLLAADSDAAYMIMSDSHQSWVDRTIAGFALVAGQGTNWFTAIREGWESAILSMDQALANFVAAALDKVQKLAEAFATVAKVSAVFTFGATLPAAAVAGHVADAAGKGREIAQGVAAGAQIQNDELGQRAYEREQKRPVAPPSALRDEQGNIVNPGVAALAAKNAGEQRQIEGRKAEEFATLGAAHAAGVGATITQDNKVNITLPPGVSRDSELAKMVGDAVQKALADNNRTALQQITQRGSR